MTGGPAICADRLSLSQLNIDMFNRAAGGRALIRSESLRKGVIIMSTYEEFAIIISVAMLIIAILSYTNKK